MNKKIITFDTTLRDGAQSPGISFSLKDKLSIIDLLDSFGIDYIEAGNPGGVPKDAELFRIIKEKNYRSRICAFSPTCKVNSLPENDLNLKAVLDTGVNHVAIVGKASMLHVNEVLKTDGEENLRMIRDTVNYLVSKNKSVIFDAEHFFDGFYDNREYALLVLKEAFDAGADTVVLCDTNGGSLPSEIAEAVRTVKLRYPEKNIGIHCHNDMGMAAAATLRAVEEGALHVQATFLGFGERCGNADFTTLLPVMMYKMNCRLNCAEQMKSLTIMSRRLSDIANVIFDEKRPFVGENAFTHKAGMHADAVNKDPRTSELISPELVGNRRNFAISELSGKSSLIYKVKEIEPNIERNSPVIDKLLSGIKTHENEGYYYENADASLELLILEALERRKKYFLLRSFKLFLSEPESHSPATATIKIEVDGAEEMTASEGNGPVNAMDKVLRKALLHFYPVIEEMRLIDYKVRVLDSDAKTEAIVRVLIESGDDSSTWNTVGVSTDIIEASWRALLDSVEYFLYKRGYPGLENSI
ncbi:MAG: citramalate synthase [Ruminococcaceae bacterium]|nr:citramalate synthase [Oscillospiraceae bacterium]